MRSAAAGWSGGRAVLPAARPRATLSSLRPASEVSTCRPFSVSRLPTAAPMLPGAISVTTGFIISSFASLHSVAREFLRDVQFDRLGGGDVGVAARVVFFQLRHAAPIERAGILRLVAQRGVVVGDGAVELSGL